MRFPFLTRLQLTLCRLTLLRVMIFSSIIFNINLAFAAPYIPNKDDLVLEHLPFKAQDPINQKIKTLRLALQKNPNNLDQAISLARTYFSLANSEGDPRYIGYAHSIIKPWTDLPNPPIDIILVRSLLNQFSHDFEGATQGFKDVLAKDPLNGEAISWLVDLNIVQSNFAEAERYNGLFVKANLNENKLVYEAVIQSIHGNTQLAYISLSDLLNHTVSRPPEFKEWVLIRLAEMAIRLNQPGLAEQHFKEALAIDPQDAYGLAAYSDFLIDHNRFAEVIQPLKSKQASDILLLRLTQASVLNKSADANDLINALQDRFSAANLRGDRLHLMEESRFELKIKNNPTKALELAKLNWEKQREPKDARCYLEAALAAQNPQGGQEVLQWMKETHYEDPLFISLEHALLKLKK